MFNETARRLFDEGKGGPLLQCALPLLTVASWGYGCAVRTRLHAYRKGILRQRQLPVPVLSVGNLTVGGSGKTPLVIALAQLLIERGIRVAVLSRGYGGAEPEKPLLVSDGEETVCDDPQLTGDEPALIARRVPRAVVVVCRERWKAGEIAVSEHSCNVILLDDGFQHLRLARDFDILVLRAASPWGNGRLLPRGPLREPLSEIHRSHLLISVFEQGDGPLSPPPEISSLGIPALAATLTPCGLTQFWPREAGLDISDLRGRRILCLSGIGTPQSFESTAAQQGADLVGHVSFGDHHHYSADDLTQVWHRARGEKADLIVTTEKDGVKIRRLLRNPDPSLPPIPAAELGVSLDLPAQEVLGEISKRVLFPTQDDVAPP